MAARGAQGGSAGTDGEDDMDVDKHTFGGFDTRQIQAAPDFELG
jgi:hypothetical protein